MMQISDRYTWQAETADGAVVAEGGDLRGCVRFSLIPQAPGLPRHEIAGVPLRSRFCRSFIKTHLNQKEILPGLFFWENGSPCVATSMDVTGDLSPGDRIGKGVAGENWYLVRRVESAAVYLTAPYKGNSKPKGFQAKKLTGVGRQSRFYYHCIETGSERIWVDYQTGAVFVTPRNHELYI